MSQKLLCTFFFRSFLILALCLTAQCLTVQTASALSLDEAKSKGLLGETASGYLDIVKADPAANSIKDDVNNKRRKQYEQIAQQNGTPVGAVEALAGKKAIENTAAGQYIKLQNGGWVKK